MKPIRIPLAPIAAMVGIALIGNGIGGSTGAGVALLTAVVIGFLIALILVDGESIGVGRTRTKRTLRHRWLLAVDAMGETVPRRSARRRSASTCGARRPSRISYGAGIGGGIE